MIESLTLAFVLSAMPAEPVALNPTPVVTQDMTPEQRRKRVARVAAAKKQKQNEARRRAAARSKADAPKGAGKRPGRGRPANGGKPYTHPSGMKVGTFKPGNAKAQTGPNLKKTGKGKDGQRAKVSAGPKRKRG